MSFKRRTPFSESLIDRVGRMCPGWGEGGGGYSINYWEQGMCRWESETLILDRVLMHFATLF